MSFNFFIFYNIRFSKFTYIITALLKNVFLWRLGVTRSRKIEPDRDYQKNKERVQKLTVLWKKEKLYSTIKKYIETLIFTWLQAFCSQIVTFKMLNSSSGFGVDRHFYMVSPSSHELGSFRECKCLSRTGRGVRVLSIDRISELVTEEGLSIPVGLFSLECPPGGRQMY